MADLIGNEEELNLLRQENQTLRDQANVLQRTIHVQAETIGLLREQSGLKDQLKVANPRLHRSSRERVLEGNCYERNKLGRALCERLRATYRLV